jgi:L-ascorbate metabolism protein UlaG (beta-lactamase superfamily)
MGIKIRWLGFACFEIILPSGKVLITDPFIDYSSTCPIDTGQLKGADYIALTHTHFDHCTDLGLLVKKYNSSVICSHLAAGALCEYFDFKWTSLVRVRGGDEVVFDDLKVQVKRAEHIYMPITREQEMNMKFEPPLDRMMPSMITAGLHQMPVRDMEMLNYVFQTGDNLRILMFGGGLFPWQRHEIAGVRPNVLIIQVGSAEETAEFAALSGAEVVIPHHHDMKFEETHPRAREIARQLASKSKARLLDIEHGKWYEIGVRVDCQTELS